MNEFVHIRIEDLYLDDESAQIHLTHPKWEACRYLPVLPAFPIVTGPEIIWGERMLTRR